MVFGAYYLTLPADEERSNPPVFRHVYEIENALADKTIGIRTPIQIRPLEGSSLDTRLEAAGIEVNLAFTVPTEGSNAVCTAMLIPAGAPHPENAHKFLNFILRPKVIAEITNEIHYANPNLASTPYVDPLILKDPAVYPTPDVLARTYTAEEVSVDFQRVRTRVWTKIKTNH